MRKGSYSEELVKVVVAMNTKEIDAPTAMLEASRRKIYLSKTACKIPILFHTNVRLHSSFTMRPQCPSQVWRCAVLQQRCLRMETVKVCRGISPRSRKKCKHCHRDKPGQDPRLCTNGHSDTLSHETL